MWNVNSDSKYWTVSTQSHPCRTQIGLAGDSTRCSARRREEPHYCLFHAGLWESQSSVKYTASVDRLHLLKGKMRHLWGMKRVITDSMITMIVLNHTIMLCDLVFMGTTVEFANRWWNGAIFSLKTEQHQCNRSGTKHPVNGNRSLDSLKDPNALIWCLKDISVCFI